MIYLKKILVIFCMIAVIALGIAIGLRIFDQTENKPQAEKMLATNNANHAIKQEYEPNEAVTTAMEEEKTTPNTLMIYKTYYTKCQHYLQEYKEIDAALVNCTQSTLQEKCRNWKIEKFSSQEVELSKEEEKFCNQHYKLKLENNVIVVYTVDEAGRETEYEQTGITTEYLTEEDILKLTTGIIIYGKENLTSTIEDYE